MKKKLAPALTLIAMLTACAPMPDVASSNADAAPQMTVADAVIDVALKALPTIIDALFGQRIAP